MNRRTYTSVVSAILLGLCAGPLLADGNPTYSLTRMEIGLPTFVLMPTTSNAAADAAQVATWLDNPPVAIAFGQGAGALAGATGEPGVVIARPPNPTGLVSTLPPGGAGTGPAWAPVGEGSLSEPGGASAPPLHVLPAPAAVVLGAIGLAAVVAYQRRRV